MIFNSIHHGFRNQIGDKIITIRAFEDSGIKCIMYSDNGCGIDDQIKGKIFDPFYTTQRGNGNSGLGLSIIYNILQSTGGSIDLIDKDDHGVQFKICMK